MKKLLISALAMCSFITMKAQLNDGMKAKDFTFNALNNNGQLVNLYSWLDSGKYVFLDVSATWCGPCWNYHQTHALDDLYTQHGPGSVSNNVRVIWVEGDGTTDDTKMSGGTGSQGNWLLNTLFPMCNPATALANTFNDDYEIGYFPTIYMICPDRTVKEVGQLTSAQLYAEVSPTPACAPKILVDATPVSYKGTTYSCDGKLNVSFDFKNRGWNNLTNAVVNLKYGSTTIATQNWTGNLATYATTNVNFGNLSIPANYDSLVLEVVAPNDGIVSNNSGTIKGVSSTPINNNGQTLTLEMQTDAYGSTENFWKLTNEWGTTIDSVNIGAIPNSTLYSKTINLPGGYGCYFMKVYDDYGDGLSYQNTANFVRIKNNLGAIVYNKTGNFSIAAQGFTKAPLGTSNFNDASIDVYPNPTSSELNVRGVNGNATFSFVDVLGRTIKTVSLENINSEIKLNVSDLSKGTYILKITNEGKSIVKSIMITE